MTSSTTTCQNEFSCIKAEYARRSIEAAFTAGRLTKRDIDLIREFIAERKAAANIGLSRANKFTYVLVGWRRFIDLPFEELSIVDVYTAIDTMKNSLTQKGRPFRQNTKHDWVRILRQFLLWMIENGYSVLPEKKIRRIKVPSVDHMTKKASDLLSSGEIASMLTACLRSVDRAFIGMLYEGGFRAGELAIMKWGDLHFDGTGIVVNVNFKTGKPRYVRIIMAKEYIAQWRNDYPGIPEGDAFVFVNSYRKPLTNNGVIVQLNRICQRAGITKHVTPHIFRHSRITHLINEGVSESVIKMIMWGSVHTNMFKVYAHLTGNDIDDELKRVYHIGEGQEKKRHPRLEPHICSHCHSVMPPVSRYCSYCGQNLERSEPATDDEIQKFVVKHPKETKEYLDQAHTGRELSVA